MSVSNEFQFPQLHFGSGLTLSIYSLVCLLVEHSSESSTVTIQNDISENMTIFNGIFLSVFDVTNQIALGGLVRVCKTFQSVPLFCGNMGLFYHSEAI